MAMQTYKGFTLTTADGWTVITEGETECGKVRGVAEAKYWVDLCVAQKGEPA